MIANLGEATSTPVRLLMLGERTRCSQPRRFPRSTPARQDGTHAARVRRRLAQLTFRLEDNHDFDAANDSLTLTLWGLSRLATLARNLDYEGALELKVGILNGPELAAQYRIVDAFSKRMIAKVVSGISSARFARHYRVAVQPYQNEGKEILFTIRLNTKRAFRRRCN